MKQILVAKKLAYAAKSGGGTISGIKEIDLLDTGAIAIFTKANVMLNSGGALAANLSDQKEFYIAVGNQTTDQSKSFLSSLIPRIGTDYAKKAYVAPVKTVKYVGYDQTTVGTSLNLPTLVKGDEVFIRITDISSSLRTVGDDTKRYSYTLATTVDDDEVVAGIVAAINADPDAIVVAAAVNTDDAISLTAKNYGVNFAVSVGGVLENSTIVQAEGPTTGVAVAPTYGEGTVDQITAIEDAFSVERGNTNRIMQPTMWYKNTSLVTAGYTYDVYTFYWAGKKITSLGAQDTYTFEVKVAIPSDGTNPGSVFSTIMIEAFGGAHSTSDVETGS